MQCDGKYLVEMSERLICFGFCGTSEALFGSASSRTLFFSDACSRSLPAESRLVFVVAMLRFDWFALAVSAILYRRSIYDLLAAF